jgi:hypothetical protein
MGQIAQIVFNTIPDGFFPAAPAGWGKPTADTTRILSGYFVRGGSTPAVFRFNTAFATNEMEVSIRLPPTLPVASLTLTSRAGGQFIDSSGNGYAMYYRLSGSNIVASVNLVVAYVPSTELFTNTFLQTGNLGKELRFRRNRTTGVMQVVLDTTQLGSDITSTVYDPTYGATSAIETGGGVHTITLTDLSVYLVNSFNGGSSIERGQQNVVYDTTFATITSITSNTAGVTVTGISDTAGDGNADISDFTEGGLYPVLPASVIYTFGDGTNTAQITKSLVIKSTESSVLTVGLVTANDTFFGYHMLAAGRSVADGCQMVWPTTAGFTLNANGSFTAAGPVTIPVWYRDVANGRVYEFVTTFTTEGGITIEDGLVALRPSAETLSASRLTALRLTALH